MKRIYIAVKISDFLQGQIIDWGKAYPSIPARWTAGKNLHITLVPPWQENDLGRIVELLRPVPQHFQPFSIHFNKIKLGPNAKKPRMIWASGSTPPELVNVKTSIEQALGQTPEPRPLSIHITLARIQSAAVPQVLGSFHN